MCGIVGYLNRGKKTKQPLGLTLYKMLGALGCRGPDSAGVALFTHGHRGALIVRVKLAEGNGHDGLAESVVQGVAAVGRVKTFSTQQGYLRLVLDYRGDVRPVERLIESMHKDVEVVSMGRSLEIIKQVGTPENLDSAYGISGLEGTHGVGHTRLSTESRVDLSHSQPFWAHGHPDVAVVHNGHITNYHKMRRRYEQKGVRFYTENDSEIIGVYLAQRLSEGLELKEALKASLVDLDGSFSYLAATARQVGFAKDPFAFKPLLFAETDTAVVVATEEMAIRSGLTGRYVVREAQAREVRVWSR
ncbi:MAG: glutamine phosphoribosylpyrophosphate amidotransferase [Planctomycetes bacterium]|nr:glutamine phosphoribosylpyrophosphate amidotransferase [Planctomycetota bacterium]